MTDPFIGEIQLFSFNFAPNQWAFCDGRTLQVRQFTALFSLLGTTYGGNGTTTFQLPNLVGRAVCSQGTGPGLSMRSLGESFGDFAVTLSAAEMPSHTHSFELQKTTTLANKAGVPAAGYGIYVPTHEASVKATSPNTSFSAMMVGSAGGSQPHDNTQPYLAINYSIALSGAFPQFN